METTKNERNEFIMSSKSKKIITEQDLNRAIVKELKKYHKDFAYVYENRDKII